MSPRTAAATRKTAPSAPVQLKKRPTQAKREPLFSIDDEIYTVPAVVPAGDAIMLTATLRLQPDEDAKGIMLVRTLCGNQALAALMGDSTMTRGEWRAIVAILTEKVFGPAEKEDEDEGN
jgi:hypothetical protein